MSPHHSRSYAIAKNPSQANHKLPPQRGFFPAIFGGWIFLKYAIVRLLFLTRTITDIKEFQMVSTIVRAVFAVSVALLGFTASATPPVTTASAEPTEQPAPIPVPAPAPDEPIPAENH